MKKVLNLFRSKSKPKSSSANSAQHQKPETKQEKKPQAEPTAAVSPMLFSELALHEEIKRAIAEEGYEHPTEIQAAAIPLVLKGRDLIGCAQTGTGKTAAFALPILDLLMRNKGTQPGALKALILSPTRELALQIAESFEAYGRHTKLKVAVVFGGVGSEPQKRALRAKPDILVATPGRFLDLKKQGFIHLDRLEIFVLDEADRMLDMGFIHDVRRILKMLPQPRQNLLFSATLPPAIKDLAMGFLHDPAKVAVTPVSSTAERIDQYVYHVDKNNKRDLLLHILQDRAIEKAIVFTRTKVIANRVSTALSKSGITAEAIHGNKSQTARQRALENFRTGKTRILVASDLAARGIDVDGITHVINYDTPNVAETYVHRIGRTGRARAAGTAISFCDHEEQAYIHGIQRLIGMKIPVKTEHPYPRSEVAPPDTSGRNNRNQRHRSRSRPGAPKGNARGGQQNSRGSQQGSRGGQQGSRGGQQGDGSRGKDSHGQKPRSQGDRSHQGNHPNAGRDQRRKGPRKRSPN